MRDDGRLLREGAHGMNSESGSSDGDQYRISVVEYGSHLCDHWNDRWYDARIGHCYLIRGSSPLLLQKIRLLSHFRAS